MNTEKKVVASKEQMPENNHPEQKILQYLQLFNDTMRCRMEKIVPPEEVRCTVNQLHTLTAVYRLTRDNRQGIRLKVLANHLHVTAAAASEMVDTLVGKQFLVREESAADRRAISVRLAPELERKYMECEQCFARPVRSFIMQLSPEKQAQALELFSALCDFVIHEDDYC